jgi:AcrR family transcriptional regulator
MPTPTRRRRETPSKGDRREQAILDATEKLLETETLESITVEAIAKGAGISRGALYFYFGSKNDALTALVERTVGGLTAAARIERSSVDATPAAAIAIALDDTTSLWREHSTVMRAAVDYAATVPEVGALWEQALNQSVTGTTTVLSRAGVPGGDGPDQAGGLARTLCWMTERNFYWAAVHGDNLEAVRESCKWVWLAVLEQAHKTQRP